MGLIYLPGTIWRTPASPLEVRAALHEGLLLSFYGYSRSKKASGPRIEKTYEVDEKPISYSYTPLLWYKHKEEGSGQFEKSLSGDFKLTGSFFPGAISGTKPIVKAKRVYPRNWLSLCYLLLLE